MKAVKHFTILFFMLCGCSVPTVEMEAPEAIRGLSDNLPGYYKRGDFQWFHFLPNGQVKIWNTDPFDPMNDQGFWEVTSEEEFIIKFTDRWNGEYIVNHLDSRTASFTLIPDVGVRVELELKRFP